MEIIVHIHSVDEKRILAKLADVVTSLAVLGVNQGKIMATQDEEVLVLEAIRQKIVKIGTETETLLQTVVDLRAEIAAGGQVTPAVQAALDAVVAQAQVVDDLVPDAPAP
jgi:hypothetical protein